MTADSDTDIRRLERADKSKLPSQALGKVERGFMKDVILRNTGASSSARVVGPGLGLDNAVVALDDERVMIVTTDPLSMIPSLGMEESAWLTIHELASDLTTSAVRPQFAVLDYNLPPELSMEDFERYVRRMSDECRRLGITIVGGHTGKYPGCDFTIVGGGVVMGIASKDEYLTPAMAGDGDKVILTKGAAIETTAVLARAFPETVREKLGERLWRSASEYLQQCSTVEDALAAASVGLKAEGVTSMHDATEGGILGGLYELALSCGKRIVTDTKNIHISEESASLCVLFGLDPLVTLSEGSLIITCKTGKVAAIRDALRKKKIDSFVIGDVSDGQPGLWVRRGESMHGVTPPEHDPYWKAYSGAMRRRWK